VIPQLLKLFVDTGKVRFVARNYPLNTIHNNAQKAAETSVCAGRQGKFWEMHDKLFASQAEWSAEGVDGIGFFKKYAQDLGLDTKAFNQCLDGGEAAIDVQADLMAGQAAGVRATPTLFVNDLPIQGGAPLETLAKVIDYVAAGGPPPNIVPAEGDFHMLGSQQTAQGAMAAFVDFASVDSAKYTLEVLPTIRTDYVDKGTLIYVTHSWADKEGSPSFFGALAAECAGEQGKFWEMQDQLFKEQKTWTSAADPRPAFAGYVQALGLDKAKFETCLASDAAKLRVQAGSVVGVLYSVAGAPQYLFSNGQTLNGAPTLDEFKATLDSMLAQ